MRAGDQPREGHLLARHQVGGVRAGGGYTVSDLHDCLPRILSYVDKRSWYECWPWQRSRSRGGYGRVEINCHGRQAHRLIWEAFNSTILPLDVFACHACDNPWCCNPRHIFPGTHTENMRDMVAKGRNAKGILRQFCRMGHTLTDDNIIVHSNARRCRTCYEQRSRLRVRPKRERKPMRRTHCKRGHAFSDENILALPDGQRRCRECSLQHGRASYARKMERRRALCSCTDAEFKGQAA